VVQDTHGPGQKGLFKVRGEAKRVITKAEAIEGLNLGEMVENEDAKGGLLRVAKQLVKKIEMWLAGGCVRDVDGTIVADDAGTMEIWKRHCEKLTNEEFDWDKNNLENVDAVSGPREWI
jgi:hypothetical protein